MKKLKKIPEFKTIEEEREFWQAHDSMNYVDWGKAKRIEFSSLKEQELYECALAVEKDANLNKEMEAWDITVNDGLE